MAQQRVLVRRLPPTDGMDWRMYARNLHTGDVKTIDFPFGSKDPDMVIIGELVPGRWVDPDYYLCQDNGHLYTIEV